MPDVVVVGGGNAGLAAALAATETGASVVVLEAAPREKYGSDSYFSGGLFRVAYESFEDLEEIAGKLEFPEDSGYENYSRYSEEQFLEDWGRVTGYRCDPELAAMIVGQSRDALAWLAAKGVAFASPVVVDSNGKARHSRAGWHGGFVEAAGAGPGLTESLIAAVEKAGIEIRFGMHFKDLQPVEEPGTGWEVRCQERSGRRTSLRVSAVVLASGGFQSDVEWRTRCLGPGWDLAKVRGSGYNTGEGLKAAFAVGAAPYGNWSGCHAVAWSVGSGDAGRRDANHLF
ncbi:MAG: FAD-dependent oxidoreductase, partial [Acidimicrobiaceae bacterium]|nr:FAD-dependent oxidoreductase [Acidimicrobiaceae bacterium]